jgi:hypothetical protein
MLISLRDILVLFEQVQKEMNIAHVSVVLFCGLDIDSLCTLKILAVRHPPLRNSSAARTSSIRCTPPPSTRSSSRAWPKQSPTSMSVSSS